MGSGERRRR